MEWTTITSSQTGQIALYLGGLFACWIAGLQIGLTIQKIRSMGKFM
ncbi:hypothetical protein [Herminiimonas contaminans]|uniref:Uncharacterized protein n=1 Tax=Herminiimonas contaminans TaxID=1111140 RepID=A0ABS0EY62_9BURK|nr:hypothetical protein [Herminiimonas contaminans]MBF8179801.1 hypothetical protein [Herminiimonas contaminans]